ncbi:MAG: PD-(D/E)XK nuclease family protein [Bacteroidales bacterium]|jgi:hypothetical protein|nr:PD-(D/E)XK nuclease family protein [Bacteroidales bacterium]
MTGFLQQTAEYLHRAYGRELQHFCIVFPNIRAGLFFKKYLAQLSDRPVWSPTFRSIRSLMEEITGWTSADRLGMVFDLYLAYREHKPTAEGFDDFYFWGEMLLDDFDDIDKHLVNPRDLFRNISDLREIDQLFDYLSEEQKEAIRVFWQDFNGGESVPLKADFAAVWPVLHLIYDSFKARLRDKSLGYDGMIQREATERIRRGEASAGSYEKYAFIGFNALTACEQRFFKSLQQAGKALFFWDTDDYYISRPWHEAGAFLRENMARFPAEWSPDARQLTDRSKRIEAIAVPSETGQADVAEQILNRLPDGDDWSRTAVVLPDEHLLLPVLSAIPAKIKDVNITMGYPFTYSPVYSLFDRLAALQQRSRIHAGEARFYHRDVNMVLHHPYVQHAAAAEAAAITRMMVEMNRVHVPEADFETHPLLRKIFKRCADARSFTACLLEVGEEIIAGFKRDSGETEPSAGRQYRMEYLYVFHTTLQRMSDVLAGGEINMEVGVFVRLLRKVFASVKIPFNGEPLKGLQIMGVLETRALDFDRVIILSMNEGIFPSRRGQPSFIPYHLRNGFGLTVSEHNDALSAWHFYRLIQRAEDVRLIYNSAATDRIQGEMSRFISQMIYEPDFDVRQRNITFRISPGKDKPIVKERTEEVRQILSLYCSQGEKKRILSPSALNIYLDCRLRFYFRYIEGLKEAGQVLDEIDPSVFGLLLHKVMENLYARYAGKTVTADMLARVRQDEGLIRETLLAAFAEYYFHTERISESHITGRNIIIREVLLKYIHRIIEIDGTVAPFTLLGLEERIDVTVPATENGRTEHVNMGGIIDRLEYSGGTLRIIDYKTGAAKRGFTAVEELFLRGKHGNHAVMQTLAYACMVRRKYPEYTHICSGLYVVKDLFKDAGYDPRIYISREGVMENYFTVAGAFEAGLNDLLAEMFLGDAPFTQTEDPQKCRNCPYAEICHVTATGR